MATIKAASAGSISNIFGAIGTTASAVTSAAGMADDYISGAAQSARVYRARATADAESKMKLAALNANEEAASWLLQRRKAIRATLETEDDVTAFQEIMATHFS